MTDWRHKPLGKVVKRIVTGSTPSTSRPEFFGGAIPWFTPGDIGLTRNLVESSRHITDKALADGKARLFKANTLLVTCIGNIGRVGILKVPASSNQQITALEFTDEVDVNYAYYWFVAYQHRLEQGATQAVVPILNNQRLKQIGFFFPALPEQQRIAGILAKADWLRRLRRYARELSDGYLQSVFLEMFGDPVTNPMGWEEASVGDVVASSQYGTSKRSNSEQRGYPILGMGNITYSGRIDLKSLSYVDLSEAEFADLRLQVGDIIFNRTNSTELVGKTAHWNLDRDAVLASYLVKLKLTKNVLPDYFTAFLNTQFYKRLFQERCKKAVGQSNISPTLLKEFPMLIPPLGMQHQFVEIVEKLERLRAQQREAERQAEHLFQTLLHRAFRGEV